MLNNHYNRLITTLPLKDTSLCSPSIKKTFYQTFDSSFGLRGWLSICSIWTTLLDQTEGWPAVSWLAIICFGKYAFIKKYQVFNAGRIGSRGFITFTFYLLWRVFSSCRFTIDTPEERHCGSCIVCNMATITVQSIATSCRIYKLPFRMEYLWLTGEKNYWSWTSQFANLSSMLLLFSETFMRVCIDEKILRRIRLLSKCISQIFIYLLRKEISLIQ